jgi:hypothetical protein
VNEDEEHQLAELLRRALREEAARHVPAGDGLSLIRERVRSRRRFGWVRPVLVMGAVTAVAAAAAMLPATLRGTQQDSPGITAGGQPVTATQAVPPAALPGPMSSASGKVTLEATGTPGVPALPREAGVEDMRTVWPYGSRAEGYHLASGDVQSGRRPELLDAGQAAVMFVHTFVGDGVKLMPGLTEKVDKGVGVVVNRLLGDGTTHPVTRVYLVQVSTQPKAPWLVAAAERPSLAHLDGKDPTALNTLTLAAPDQAVAADTNQISVSGSVRRVTASAIRAPVKVELCDVNGVALSFNQTYADKRIDEATYTWQTVINIDPAQLAQATSIAAWTLDGNSDVLEFVALPAPAVRGVNATAFSPPSWNPPS